MADSQKILWCNLSGSFSVGLDQICPIRVVACLDDGAELPLLEKRSGVEFISRERKTRRRIVAHDPATDDILRLQLDEIRAVMADRPGSAWALVCPRPSRFLEEYAAAAGARAISPSSSLCHQLNDKAFFLRGRAAAGLAVSPGRWMASSAVTYSGLVAEFGVPFVIQAPRGTTGSGTAIVDSDEAFSRALGRLPAGDLWCAPYLGSLSLNINAVATEAGTVVSYPSVQLEGLSVVGARPGKYCGNDFSATGQIEGQLVSEVQEQTRRLGKWVASLGYRGLFGADFVIDENTGRAVAVDLNPRWQGSTMLDSMASAKAGKPPLAAAEIAWLTGALSAAELVRDADRFGLPHDGAQILLYATGESPVLVRNEVHAGAYRFDGRLEFVRPGVDFGACQDDGELLVTSGVVQPGTTVDPGARPCRLLSTGAAVDPANQALLAWVKPALHQLYGLFGMEAPEPE